MKQRPICLASASPRRKTLLTQYGLTIQVAPADIDETQLPNEAPQDYVLRLARAKAGAVQPHYLDHMIVAADTIVTIENTLLGKPKSRDDIHNMMQKLSGKIHQVLSGYCLLSAETTPIVRCVKTEVSFRVLPSWWIDWYAENADVLDKSGGYGIQEWGALMINQVNGSYTNVMGLPVEPVFWDLIEAQWVHFS